MRVVFVAALTLYLLTGYGGIRSPDAEVVFETCDALQARGTWAVQGESAWEGFGLASGRDQRRYSIFGPLQPLLCAPLLAVVDLAGPADWFRLLGLRIPPSLNVGRGLQAAVFREPVEEPIPHARRSLVAWVFGAIVSAASAAWLFRIVSILGATQGASRAVACLFAAGSLAWPYAGTFFSEPLSTLLTLVAFERIVASQRGYVNLGVAGVALGLAIAAHLVSILWLPFLAAIAWSSRDEPGGRRAALAAVLLGVLPSLIALGGFNFWRFGSFLETGRTVDPIAASQFGYGRFTAPWRGLLGLIGGGTKGIVFSCPAVLLGISAWPSFHRRHRTISWALAAAALARLAFIASRSDWHGGFSHGPRYLVGLVPFLLIPVGIWLDEAVRQGRTWRILGACVFGFGCVLVTWQLVASEYFTWLHTVRAMNDTAGVDVLAADRLYLDWALIPFVGGLSNANPAPMLFGACFDSGRTLWLAGAAVLLAAWTLGSIALVRPALSARSAGVALR